MDMRANASLVKGGAKGRPARQRMALVAPCGVESSIAVKDAVENRGLY